MSEVSRMPYTQEISRERKACFLFLLDQSYSMEEPLGNSARRKCDELVTAINAWLQNMAIRATGDVGIKDWMDIGVLGYRTDFESKPIIESALQGPLAGRTLVSITGARGMSYNASMVELIKFLDMGTRAATPGALR
jgi:hypothetical protein